MIEQERIQAFWKKCGFTTKPFAPQYATKEEPDPVYVFNPDGKLVNCFPPIEPTPLFKYAVPLVDKIRLSYSNGCYYVAACKGNPWESASWSYDFDNEDLATALFLALDQAL